MVIHFIQIANELRRMDNYFISHAVQHGIRMTIHPGELLAQSVAKDPLYKVYQSLERLYEVADNHKKYRLALEMTTRPGIPDLCVYSPFVQTGPGSSTGRFSRSVHVVDFTKFETTPDFSVADKTKINWGRAMSICKQYLQIGALQKRFHAVNTHDYVDRPKVRRIIMETPTMPEIVRISRRLASESSTFLTFRAFVCRSSSNERRRLTIETVPNTQSVRRSNVYSVSSQSDPRTILLILAPCPRK